MEPGNPAQAAAGKARERRAFLLLTLVIFPLLAVCVVAGYGFLVWMWQMFAGPPTAP